MIPPQGVSKPGQEGMVCKLKKALYGLKQAGREWYKTLKESFYKMGYSRSNVDHSIFYIHSEKRMSLSLLPLMIWLLRVHH
jgi:hypothetical protein